MKNGVHMLNKWSKLSSRIVCWAVLMCLTGVAIAAKPKDITETEMRLVPEYCPYTQGFGKADAYGKNSPEGQRWVSLMGRGFLSLHHYCWGQINLIRARRSDVSSSVRSHMLSTVRDDFKFVLNATDADFILRPEIYTRLGDVELMMRNIRGANAAFSQARALKRDYWPAYSRWAEYLIRSGKRNEAKKLIQTGLKYSPTSQVLREQYRLVGGNAARAAPEVEEQDE